MQSPFKKYIAIFSLLLIMPVVAMKRKAETENDPERGQIQFDHEQFIRKRYTSSNSIFSTRSWYTNLQEILIPDYPHVSYVEKIINMVMPVSLVNLKKDSPKIVSMAFNSDIHLVTGLDDSTLKTWDTITHKVISALKDDMGYRIAFSPDGSRAVIESYDGTFKISNTFTNKVVTQVKTPNSMFIHSIVLSSDNNMIAFVLPLGKIQVQHIIKEQPVITLKSSERANSAAFSPDNKILAVASINNIQLWDLDTKQLRATLNEGKSTHMIAFSPDPNSKILASASMNDIKIWNIENNSELTTLTTQDEQKIFSIAFSRDGNILAASSDKAITLWDIQTKTKVITLPYHNDSEHLSILFSLGDKTLAGFNTQRILL
jgi:WD40 repeat protein